MTTKDDLMDQVLRRAMHPDRKGVVVSPNNRKAKEASIQFCEYMERVGYVDYRKKRGGRVLLFPRRSKIVFTIAKRWEEGEFSTFRLFDEF